MNSFQKTSSSTFLLFNSLIVLAVSFLIYQAIFKSEKIVYVDSAKIMSEYKGFAIARTTYESKTKVWQSNIDTLTEEVQASIGKYEKSLATMSSREQEMAKQLIDGKQKELADYQRAIQENARQEDSKLTQAVISEINAFLQRYGKSHNYKMILIANQSGTIAYAKEGLDITNEVIKELNDNYVQK